MEAIVDLVKGVLMIPVVFMWIVVVAAAGMFVVGVVSVIYGWVVSNFNN